jgi:hypothetical protein
MSLKLKQLVQSGWQCSEKTRGEKMKVTSIMLLKAHGEKMSDLGLSIMLLKINKLKPPFHYVDENTGSY